MQQHANQRGAADPLAVESPKPAADNSLFVKKQIASRWSRFFQACKRVRTRRRGNVKRAIVVDKRGRSAGQATVSPRAARKATRGLQHGTQLLINDDDNVVVGTLVEMKRNSFVCDVAGRGRVRFSLDCFVDDLGLAAPKAVSRPGKAA